MVMDLFDSLLEEFSKAADIPDLKPDSNHSCLVCLPEEGPKIQMEIDPSGNFFLLGCHLGFLPAGRYQENVFKEALKANGLPPPHYGDFAYSKKAEKLVLFCYIPIKNLNGEKIAAVFEPFAEKAAIWKEAIDRGEVPSILGSFGSRRGGGGMFGL